MKNKITSTILVVVIMVVAWSEYSSLLQENKELKNEIHDYRTALESANNNIEEANAIIEDAQSRAWRSYDEMGEALEDMYLVDTVSEPNSGNLFLDFRF